MIRLLRAPHARWRCPQSHARMAPPGVDEITSWTSLVHTEVTGWRLACVVLACFAHVSKSDLMNEAFETRKIDQAGKVRQANRGNAEDWISIHRARRGTLIPFAASECALAPFRWCQFIDYLLISANGLAEGLALIRWQYWVGRSINPRLPVWRRQS